MSQGETEHHKFGERRRHGASMSSESVKPGYGLEYVLIGALFLVLTWSPLPYGSNRAFFLPLLLAAIGVLLTAWGLAATLGLVRASRMFWRVWPAGMAFGVAMAFATFQIVDLRGIDSVLGTRLAVDVAHPLWSLAGETLGQPLPAYVSVNPALSEAAFAKSFLYAGVFCLAFFLSRQSGPATLVLSLVAISASINVLIGVTQNLSSLNFASMLLGDDAPLNARFSGTFANPNHFATYCGIGLIAALALSYDQMMKHIVLDRGRSIAMRTTFTTLFGPALPGLASVLMLSLAVLLTMSRGGLLALLAGCLVLAAILTFLGSGARAKRNASVANWAVGIVILVVVLVAGAPLLSRYSSGSFDESVRPEIFSTTMDAISASPVAGNGFGAFTQYYPLYANKPSSRTINAAHNDYLQTFSDLGLVGGGAFILAPVILVAIAGFGVLRRRRAKIFGAAAVSAAVLCGVHALFEFSLQIPAVGLMLFTLLGVGVAQAWRGEGEADADPRMSA